jgi:CO/xanthine dehydrogenase Mo-binding subunit
VSAQGDPPRHAGVEPHATITKSSGDRLTAWNTTQCIANARQTLPALFDVPLDH